MPNYSIPNWSLKFGISFVIGAWLLVFSYWDMLYDLMIIGGGPAGIASAIHAKRFNLKFVVIEKNALGGQAVSANQIYNYPGFPDGINGRSLMDKFIAQLHSSDTEILKCEVKEVVKNDGGFLIKTSNKDFLAKTIIIAVGLVPKKLEDFKSSENIFYYPDPLKIEHSGKVIKVIGGGDSAFDYAISFSKLAKKVIIVMRSETPKCTERLYNEAVSKGVEIVKKCQKLVQNAGIFVICAGKEADFSIIHSFDRQNLPKGLFLAGDLLHPETRHVAVAVGDGVMATEEVFKCLSA